MSADRLERLIALILSTTGDELEKTKRIEIVCAQYKAWAERRSF